jgi:hypothetical protein
MSTGQQVAQWVDACEAHGMALSATRGRIAALLVLRGYCITRSEALRYVRALIA